VLEATTPLLLHGVNSREPEIRAQSFKGMMRWTMRTLLGALYDVDTVKKLDFVVNGDTSHASMWSLSVSGIGKIQTGKYGYYKGYKEGTRLYVELLSDDKDIMKLVEIMFGAFVRNFGVGQRWRHGYGKLKRYDGHPLLKDDLPFIDENVKKVASKLSISLRPNTHRLWQYPYVYVDDKKRYAFTVNVGKGGVEGAEDVKNTLKFLFGRIGKKVCFNKDELFGAVGRKKRIPSRVIYRPLSGNKVRVIFLMIPRRECCNSVYSALIRALYKEYH